MAEVFLVTGSARGLGRHIAEKVLAAGHVVVNNAGYADTAAVEDVTDAAFRAQIDTNLLGVVNVTKRVRCRCCASRAAGTSSRSRRSAAACRRRACPPVN